MSSTYRHQCQNCSKNWSDDEIKSIKDLHERVAPGEPMPSGECPECGALTHRINYYKQRVTEIRRSKVDYTVAATSIEEAKNMTRSGDTVEECYINCDGVTQRVPSGDLELVDPPAEKNVSLIPGLTTPEGQKRIAELLHHRNHLDYQCFQLLQTIVSHYDDRFSGLLIDDAKKASKLVAEREKANHEFMEAAAGRED